MNFKEALEKLKKSKEFMDFKKKNPKAYLCVAFFIMDFESNQNSRQLDFQLNKKVATFSIADSISMKLGDTVSRNKIHRIKESVKVELDKVEAIARKEIIKLKLGETKKIIAILQNLDGKQTWNLTCMFDSLKLLNMHIDSETGKILKSEPKSVAEFFNKPVSYVG